MIIAQPDRRLLKRFLEKNAPSLQGDILDVGGGKRRYADLFAAAKSYRCLDINPAVKPDILASAENIPLPDNSTDTIICCQVLGDVWDVPAAIGEMMRVLRPGGHLLITEALHAELHDEPCDYWRFTPFAWKTFLEGKCEILQLETRGGYHTLRLQQHLRYFIEKWHLYDRALLGRLANLYALPRCIVAEWRDRGSNSALREKFAIGTNILARKR